MLVRLADEPEVVALIPTLAADTPRLRACVTATAQQQSGRRLAVLCIVNAPLAPGLIDLPPEVEIVTAGLNLGWAGALRFGRGLVGAPLLWLVQDDMRAAPDCLDELLSALGDDHEVGLVAPVVVGAGGLVPAASCGGFLDDEGVMSSWYPRDPTPLAALTETDALSYVPSRGALVRTEAWDAIGGMDPRYYPVMWADVDVCHALRRGGLRFRLVPTAEVAHDAHGSTTSSYAMFLAGRNAELFAAKWFPDSTAPRNPPAPPRRPSPPGALTGTIHPELDPALVATVAQASADTLAHLARNYSGPTLGGVTDAVVVGAGPNGLAAAVAIAQAGHSVTVFEGHDTIGGGTRTEELLMPGVLHDVCSAVHPFGAASPFFQTLDLEAHGLRWAWAEYDLAHPIDGGRAGVMQRSLDATADGFGEDAAAWRNAFAPVVDRYAAVLGEFFQPMLHVPRHPLTMARFGLPMLLSATRFARRFRRDETRGLFAGIAAHSFQPLTRPTTAAAGLMFIGAAHTTGWPVAIGGSQSVTNALASLLRSLGGTIETGIAVKSLADLPPHRVALLDVAPQAAIGIVGDRMPTGVKRAYGRWKYGPAAFKVDFVVEGGIPWDNDACRRAGTVHCGGTLEEIAAAERTVHGGQMVDLPYVLVGQQYLADPSRSSGDHHPIWAYAHVPHGYTGDATEAVLNQIARFAPGLRDRIVAIASKTPSEFETYNPNYVGGDIAGGENSPRQLVMKPRSALDPYRIAADVFLCSSATPPGAGVHGMCGSNAARSALKHLRA